VWATIAAFTGAVLCLFAQWYALAPSIARDVYGSTAVFGLLEGVAGAGAVLGAVVGLRWHPAHPLRAGLLLVLAWPVACGGLAFGVPLALETVLVFGTGIGFSLLMVWWESALAHHIPPHALSRVSAWDWMGSLALLPVGYLIAGPLAAALGARAVLGWGSAIGLVVLGLALVPKATRELRELPEEIEPEPRARPERTPPLIARPATVSVRER
jgi:hypothetical protein